MHSPCCSFHPHFPFECFAAGDTYLVPATRLCDTHHGIGDRSTVCLSLKLGPTITEGNGFWIALEVVLVSHLEILRRNVLGNDGRAIILSRAENLIRLNFVLAPIGTLPCALIRLALAFGDRVQSLLAVLGQFLCGGLCVRLAPCSNRCERFGIEDRTLSLFLGHHPAIVLIG